MFPVFVANLPPQDLNEVLSRQLPVVQQASSFASAAGDTSTELPQFESGSFPKTMLAQDAAVIVPGPGAPLQETVPAPTETFPFQYQPQKVLPLPGHLDKIPVFNSNSPELLRSEGILLSTFPSQGKTSPEAHLNFPLQGRFDLFAHHVTQLDRPHDATTLYIGLLLFNPGSRSVTVDLMQAASFLSTPDAPFRNLPSLVDNTTGYVFSGPGSRVMNQVLRGSRQNYWPSQILIPPSEARMLATLPIPLPKLRTALRRPPSPAAQLLVNQVGEIQPLVPLFNQFPIRNQTPSSNGRSTFMRLQTNGRVYAASLAMYSRLNFDGTETPPTLEDWATLLVRGRLASPRDIPPSSPNYTGNPFYYGRVAGISQGSAWQAKLTDTPSAAKLTIPRPGQSLSYAISTVPRGTFGTGQIQSAPMLTRYPDTAYFANGNYGVHYDLTLPLYNPTRQVQSIAISLQTPLKQDQNRSRLDFLNPPASQVFFRGTVRLGFNDDLGTNQTRYVHLVQRRGERGNPLSIISLQPSERRTVEVDFLYPPDATPPQVLTVSTLLGPAMVTTQKPTRLNSQSSQFSQN